MEDSIFGGGKGDNIKARIKRWCETCKRWLNIEEVGRHVKSGHKINWKKVAK